MRLTATFASHGRERTKSFIVKVHHFQEGVQKELLAETRIFEVEIEMYSQVLPEMQRLYREVDPEEVLAPHLSFSSLTPHKVVVVEDLSADFATGDPLDFDNSVKVFRKLGIFHALSFFMHAEEHVDFERFSEGFISERMRPMVKFMNMQFGVFAEILSCWGLKDVAEKYRALIPNLFEKALEVSKRNPRGYNVLNHGDFHLKNVLLKKDAQGKVEDIRMVSRERSIN